jgi:pimeloyl-ACP methyl ester carboxylesterase
VPVRRSARDGSASTPVLRRIALTAALLAAALTAATATAAPAAAELPHQAPQKAAKVRFGPGFPALVDHEWGFALGGFGGVSPRAPRTHVPVILVHGNNVDHADWYPVRDDFHAAGWTDQELWALSYNGLGANNGTALLRTNPERDAEHTEMGWDGAARITNDDGNVPDLYDFILAVRAYTGSTKFSLVGHSLGVTLARKTLQQHPELRADLVAFVGIAGANHGTTFCPPGSEGVVVSCNEIAKDTPWLADLNGPDGADETYAPARWLTIFDGSGAGDPAFVGPPYAQSPALRGADNRQFPGTYHNDLRIDADIVKTYRLFLEDAERPFLAAAPAPPSTPTAAPATTATMPTTDTLPVTGGTDEPVLLAALAIALALALRRVRPHRSPLR